MELPITLTKTITLILEKLRTDPEYSFSPFERFQVYKAFGPFNRIDFREALPGQVLNKRFSMTFADKVLSWLTIITARKVLPVWEEEQPTQSMPQEMLKLAERFLLEEISDIELTYEIELAGNWVSNADIEATEKAYWAANCAYEALELTTSVVLVLAWHTNPDYKDESSEGSGSDFARSAVRAYSLTVNEANWIIVFDTQKRLEFWEWWLTEAIPEAWELAHSSSP